MINRSFLFWDTSNYIFFFFFFLRQRPFGTWPVFLRALPSFTAGKLWLVQVPALAPGYPLVGSKDRTWILLFPVSYVDPDALLFVCWHFTACTRIQGVHVPCRMEKFTRHPPVHPYLTVLPSQSLLYLQASPILDQSRGTAHKPPNGILFQGHRARAVKKCFQGAGMVWVIDTLLASSHPCVPKYKLSQCVSVPRRAQGRRSERCRGSHSPSLIQRVPNWAEDIRAVRRCLPASLEVFCTLAITAGTRREGPILVLLFRSVASIMSNSLRPHGL